MSGRKSPATPARFARGLGCATAQRTLEAEAQYGCVDWFRYADHLTGKAPS